MLFGNREPRSLVARRRGGFRPKGDWLERRELLAIDVGAAAPPTLPAMATTPYGVVMAGGNASGGAGFVVTDVGDMNGDGYDDFAISSPGVTSSAGQIGLATGSANSTVYLVFGSRTTTSPVISDWLANNSTQRVGDLLQLGNSPASQQNPITGASGYPFAGIKIITSQTSGSQLGASISSAGIINGVRAMLIGAPGAKDANGNNSGTGRAYLIFGGSALNSVPNNTLDLDSTNQNSGVTFTTFVNNSIGSGAGRAVAGIGDVITDGLNDIAIGAPFTTANGLGDSGAVYVVSGTALTAGGTINLSTVGQSGGTAGVIFTGTAAGDEFGYSLSAAGNVDGALTTANQPIDDFLIGSPQPNTGAGKAYLVYGAINLPAQAALVGGVRQILASRIGSTNSDTVSGLTVNGTTPGDLTGWAVAQAGDFNLDGLSDIIIGSPGYSNSRGRADIFYGAPLGAAPLIGTITLNNVPTQFLNATMVGQTAGDLAGYAVAGLARIVANQGNPIAIGAPGFNNNNGTVYILPGNPDLEGVHNLGAAETDPTVAATQFTITTPGVPTTAFFGASISSKFISAGQSHTVDSDLIGDFAVGAPGYAATSSRGLNGGAFIFQGAGVPLRTPVSTVITTTIGVGAATGPFVVNPSTPTTLDIYVYSNSAITPAFNPVTQIDPTTVVVNGVPYNNATIKQDPVDENKDGIPDAIITISPRSNLGLTTNVTSLTITGRTLAASANPNRRWTGTASITVSSSGGNTGGSTGGALLTPIGTVVPTQFIPPFGPDVYVPPISALSAYSSYKAIPLRVALQQYQPQPGFGQRMQQFYHPTSKFHQFGYFRQAHGGHGNIQLGYAVFTRSKYKPGQHTTFTHKVPVVPSTRQTQRL